MRILVFKFLVKVLFYRNLSKIYYFHACFIFFGIALFSVLLLL